jgi:hypothetical protein
MDDEEGVREYTAGDEIRWQLTVTHDPGMYLRRVRAIFEHQDSENASTESTEAREPNRIELGVAFLPREDSVLQPTTTPAETTSRGVLQGRVLADDALGECTCLYVEAIYDVEATYSSGKPIRFDPESTRDIRFRVVEATVSKPKVRRSEFLPPY